MSPLGCEVVSSFYYAYDAFNLIVPNSWGIYSTVHYKAVTLLDRKQTLALKWIFQIKPDIDTKFYQRLKIKHTLFISNSLSVSDFFIIWPPRSTLQFKSMKNEAMKCSLCEHANGLNILFASVSAAKSIYLH